MSFDGIIGNAKVKKVLNDSLGSKNILHSYLFVGLDGIGKSIFAKEFAKNILCENLCGCGNCKSCIQFDTGNNPDFSVVLPEGNSIKIDQIRSIQERIIEKPIVSNKKVYIIDGADKMTVEAQNCFLKTLEEPQDFVVIILIASNENALLTTIKSRCTKIVFDKISNDDITFFMKEKFSSVHFDNSMIELSCGSLGKAINIVEKSEILRELQIYVDDICEINELDFFKLEDFFIKNKEDIFILLDYFTSLFFDSLRNEVVNRLPYINSINIIQKAKCKLSNSNNFDMTIDDMLFKIWEEFNEKNNRY